MANQLSLNRTRLLASLGWLAGFGILLLYQKSCSYSPYHSTHMVAATIDLLSLVACSYIIRRFFIPKFLNKKRIAAFIGWFILLVLVFSNLKQWTTWSWYDLSKSLPPSAADDIKTPFYQVFTGYLVVIFGSLLVIALQLAANQWMQQARFAELQREKAQTELNFLKAQVNPHFLFNSINSIYAHIDKNNKTAREIVLKFSDMLRYQLYECGAEKINVEKEINYLYNYIELQRLRKNENIEIEVQVTGDTNGFEIAPMLISPFIENAFKYVSSDDDRKNLVKIVIEKGDCYFKLYCYNTKDTVVAVPAADISGIGINNVRRRLELLYPAKHTLEINNGHDYFEVLLQIETT